MGILKTILIGLVALVALLLVVGLILPSSAHVERSIQIDAPTCTVHTLANGFGRFNDWSPWYGRDPEARYTFEGPDFGVGAKMSWESESRDVGVGSQEIVESTPELIGTKLDFGPQGTADAFFKLAEQGEGTQVTWGFDTDFGMNLIGRYFGLFFDSMIGGDYEAGLASLKELAESLPDTDWCNLEAEVTTVEPVALAYASGDTSQDPADIGPALGAAYGQVMAFVQKAEIGPVGPPLAIANYYDERGYSFDAGVPISGPAELPADSSVKIGQTYGGKVIKAVHTGPYDDLVATYEALEAMAAAHGYEQADRTWEEYVDDPESNPPEELTTHIYWPIGS